MQEPKKNIVNPSIIQIGVTLLIAAIIYAASSLTGNQTSISLSNERDKMQDVRIMENSEAIKGIINTRYTSKNAENDMELIKSYMENLEDNIQGLKEDLKQVESELRKRK